MQWVGVVACEYIRDTCRHRTARPSPPLLDNVHALHVLFEIGVETMQRDYTDALIGISKVTGGRVRA